MLIANFSSPNTERLFLLPFMHPIPVLDIKHPYFLVVFAVTEAKVLLMIETNCERCEGKEKKYIRRKKKTKR